ncbi:NAD(P)-binding domain-containing protein [Streptomyces mirabilis]|uniref:NAD(P)-binding domain-containing protein n=1 Tax=Streptomyces mirabilis TaxID=68239 RepID=UPI0036CBB196
MKIGILGTGNIGKTLTRRLSAARHEVKAANSRGPETIEAGVLSSGGRAVTAVEAVVDVDAVILSIPFDRIPQVAPLIAKVPAGTVVTASPSSAKRSCRKACALPPPPFAGH